MSVIPTNQIRRYQRAKKEVELSYSVKEIIFYIRRENPSNIVCHICLPDASVMKTLNYRLERSEHYFDKKDSKSKKDDESNGKLKHTKKQVNRQFLANRQYKIECSSPDDLSDVIDHIIKEKRIPQRIEFGERYHFLHIETMLNGEGNSVFVHKYRLLDTWEK